MVVQWTRRAWFSALAVSLAASSASLASSSAPPPPMCAPKGHSCSPTPGSYPDCCGGLTCDLDGGYVCRDGLRLAPPQFFVDFQTDVAVGDGVITFNVTRALAPLGADHLYALVLDGFYDMAAFFRVVPGFVVQFGIAGEPDMNRKWDKPIRDDPVVHAG